MLTCLDNDWKGSARHLHRPTHRARARQVEWLTTELRMTKKEAASVIFGNPGVLLSSVERSLEPKITWMVQHLYLERDMVIDMIRR